MKRTVKTAVLLLLIIASAISVISCGGDMKTYKEGGLVYTLPKDMRLGSVPTEIADKYYTNDNGAEFFIYFISRDSLLVDYYLDKDCTPEEYAVDFVNYMGYTDVTRVVDPSGFVIQYYEYRDESEEDFYYDFIIRSTETLFHVTMCCDIEKKDEYLPLFEEWAKKIHVE